MAVRLPVYRNVVGVTLTNDWERMKDWPAHFDKYKCLYEVEKVFEWDKWRTEIPYIQWPSDWAVRAIPPFHVGVIRYNVTKPNTKIFTSIYLDCYDRSGCVGEPYWEVYPVDGDCERILMSEPVENLVAVIRKSIEQQENKP